MTDDLKVKASKAVDDAKTSANGSASKMKKR
jgi:hypothetical protein